MPHYCVHILDSSGNVIGVGQFDCINSETAQERIKQLAGDLKTELWQLIASFDAGTNASAETSQVRSSSRRVLHS